MKNDNQDVNKPRENESQDEFNFHNLRGSLPKTKTGILKETSAHICTSIYYISSLMDSMLDDMLVRYANFLCVATDEFNKYKLSTLAAINKGEKKRVLSSIQKRSPAFNNALKKCMQDGSNAAARCLEKLDTKDKLLTEHANRGKLLEKSLFRAIKSNLFQKEFPDQKVSMRTSDLQQYLYNHSIPYEYDAKDIPSNETDEENNGNKENVNYLVNSNMLKRGFTDHSNIITKKQFVPSKPVEIDQNLEIKKNFFPQDSDEGNIEPIKNHEQISELDTKDVSIGLTTQNNSKNLDVPLKSPGLNKGLKKLFFAQKKSKPQLNVVNDRSTPLGVQKNTKVNKDINYPLDISNIQKSHCTNLIMATKPSEKQIEKVTKKQYAVVGKKEECNTTPKPRNKLIDLLKDPNIRMFHRRLIEIGPRIAEDNIIFPEE